MSAAWRDPATRRADLLLRGGRLIDPASNRDGVADVAIRNGREQPVCRTFLYGAVGLTARQGIQVNVYLS
jgi:hypothetical protein